MKTDQTQLYYDQNADSYSATTLNVSLDPVWKLLTTRLPAGSLILDLGCGAGRDLKYFADIGYRVIGADFSPNLVAIARCHSNQRVDVTDFRSLPYDDQSFDAVWAIASLLHVSRDHILGALSHIHRVLKPSGVFLASIKRGTGERVDEKGRYFAYYQLDEWKTLLESNGFVGITILENEELRTIDGEAKRIPWLVSVCEKAASEDAAK